MSVCNVVRGARKLTEAQVITALVERKVADKDLAQEYGVSRQTIASIRSGALYKKIAPELVRRPFGGWDCHRCKHWKKWGCSFDFPESKEEGTGFAADCDLYASESCPPRERAT